MNLPTRIYRYLRFKKPNEWQTEEDIVKIARSAGYGEREVVSVLDDLAHSTPRHMRILERAKKRGKRPYYRWTEKGDWEKARLDGLKWFDEYPCQCAKCKAAGKNTH